MPDIEESISSKGCVEMRKTSGICPRSEMPSILWLIFSRQPEPCWEICHQLLSFFIMQLQHRGEISPALGVWQCMLHEDHFYYIQMLAMFVMRALGKWAWLAFPGDVQSVNNWDHIPSLGFTHIQGQLILSSLYLGRFSFPIWRYKVLLGLKFSCTVSAQFEVLLKHPRDPGRLSRRHNKQKSIYRCF